MAWLLFSFFASFGKETYLAEVQQLLQKGAIVYAMGFTLFGLGLGLFERETRFNKMRSLPLIAASSLLALPTSMFALYLLTFEKVGRWSLVLGSLGSFLVIYVLIHVVGSFLLKSHPHRFIFLGATSAVGKKFVAVLQEAYTPQIEYAGQMSDQVNRTLQTTTDFDALASKLRDESISVIVFSWDSQGDAKQSEFLLAAIRQGLRVVEDVTYYTETVRRIPIDELSQNYILKMGFDIHRPLHGFAKRCLDMLVAFILLIALFPCFILISLLISLESRGSPFYIQKRVGRFGREFRLFKFRTMLSNSDDPKYFTTKGDSRITRVGKILRMLHIDELPQLWNILAGDMSIVGPRPLASQMVQDAVVELPIYNLRHIVRPGLTGLAQIFQGQTSSDKGEMTEKLAHDLYYIKNFNVFLDVWIISRTAFRLMFATW